MTATYILRPDQTRAGVLANVIRQLQALPASRAWEVEIKAHRKQRTDDQNKALFGCAYKAIRDETGNSVDDLHAYFCGAYFGWREIEVMGQRRRVPMRTTTTAEDGRRAVMTTIEFADFYTFIQADAMEKVGVIVPDPDPLWRERVAEERRKAA